MHPSGSVPAAMVLYCSWPRARASTLEAFACQWLEKKDRQPRSFFLTRGGIACRSQRSADPCSKRDTAPTRNLQ